MTDEDLKEAVKLAQKTLQDAEIAYGGIKIPIGAERVLFARAVLHLTERLKRAEAVCALADKLVHIHVIQINGACTFAEQEAVIKLDDALKAWREGK